MDTQAIEKNWSEIKGIIKKKWTKFNDEDLDSLKGDLNQLAGKVQKAYGTAKDHADKEFEEFKKSIQSLITVESSSVKSATKSTTKLTLATPASTQKPSWVISAEVEKIKPKTIK